MPAFPQKNVSIKLLTSELSTTLHDQLHLRMGKQFNHDTAVVKQNLLRGVPLIENSLLPDTSDKALNFTLIGTASDKPCALLLAHRDRRVDLLSEHDVDQALALTITAPIRMSELDDSSSRKKPKDLKIEVFLNGELLEVIARKCRRPSDKETTDEEIDVVSGMRFHRQTEKPLVYRNTSTAATLSGSMTADERWSHVDSALKFHVEDIGYNDNGTLPLSGDYLLALSDMPLPERVREQGNCFSIIDVVITTGKKAMDDASSTYIKRPIRLRHPGCTSKHYFGDTDCDSHEQPVPLSTMASDPQAAQSHPRQLRVGGLLVAVPDSPLEDELDSTQLPAYSQSSIYSGTQNFHPYEDVHPDEWPLGPQNHDHYMHSPLRDWPSNDAIPRKAVIYERTDIPGNYFQESDDHLHRYIDPQLLAIRHNEMERQEEESELNTAARLSSLDGNSAQEPSLPLLVPVISINPTATDTPLPQTPIAVHEPTSSLTDTSPTRYHTAIQTRDGKQLDTGQENISLSASVGSDVFDISPARFYTAHNSPDLDSHPFGGDFAIGPEHTSPVSSMTKAMHGSRIASPSRSPPKRLWSQANQSNEELYDLGLSAEVGNTDSPSHLIASAPSGASYSIKSVKKTRGRPRKAEVDTQRTTKSGRRKHRSHLDDQEDLTGSPVKPGAHRTARKWDPQEQTIEQALASFRIPDLCQDSAVSFAGDGIMRQIGKARRGEFTKDEFVVGVRFIVF